MKLIKQLSYRQIKIALKKFSLHDEGSLLVTNNTRWRLAHNDSWLIKEDKEPCREVNAKEAFIIKLLLEEKYDN